MPVFTNAVYTEEDVLMLYTQNDVYRIGNAWKSNGGNIVMIPNSCINSLHVAGLKFGYQLMDRPGESERGLFLFEMSSLLNSESKEIGDKMMSTWL